MTPTTLAAFAAALWLGGAAAAVGSYDVRHRAERPAPVVEQAPSFAQIYENIPPPEPLATERVISLPNVSIVGATPAQTRAAKPVERRCGAWRPLEQGSNMVQICE